MDEQLQKEEGVEGCRFWNAEMCAQKPHMFDIVITVSGCGKEEMEEGLTGRGSWEGMERCCMRVGCSRMSSRR